MPAVKVAAGMLCVVLAAVLTAGFVIILLYGRPVDTSVPLTPTPDNSGTWHCVDQRCTTMDRCDPDGTYEVRTYLGVRSSAGPGTADAREYCSR
jgi:hypothetical protein